MENLAGRTYGKWTVLDDYTQGKDSQSEWTERSQNQREVGFMLDYTTKSVSQLQSKICSPHIGQISQAQLK